MTIVIKRLAQLFIQSKILNDLESPCLFERLKITDTKKSNEIDLETYLFQGTICLCYKKDCEYLYLS